MKHQIDRWINEYVQEGVTVRWDTEEPHFSSRFGASYLLPARVIVCCVFRFTTKLSGSPNLNLSIFHVLECFLAGFGISVFTSREIIFNQKWHTVPMRLNSELTLYIRNVTSESASWTAPKYFSLLFNMTALFHANAKSRNRLSTR
jgi:hypothetical protein